MSIRSIFIKLLVASLVIGSILSIGIFLFSEFGRIESRILWTISSLGLFSLMGLCSSIIYESDKYRRLSLLGICCSIFAFIIALLAIWEVEVMDYLGKPMIICLVIGVAVAHVALLIRLHPRNALVDQIRKATYVLIAVLATLIILGVIFEFFDADGYWRIIGVVAILDVLGTILVPILHATMDKDATYDGKINYNNRRFKVATTSENSETDQSTVFHYQQEGDVLTCSYSGGNIKSGQLIGKVDQSGIIDMRYHQVNNEGVLMTGKCRSTPEILDSGKIRLHEEWEWTSGDLSRGTSSLQEI